MDTILLENKPRIGPIRAQVESTYIPSPHAMYFIRNDFISYSYSTYYSIHQEGRLGKQLPYVYQGILVITARC